MAKNSDDRRLELLQGTLDMLILRTLQWGAQHGHGIGQAIRTQSDDLLRVETGSLYPALHRLEKRGSREQDRWSQLVNAIGRIMNPAPANKE
jgi:PadR family transcriptional regulator PadR